MKLLASLSREQSVLVSQNLTLVSQEYFRLKQTAIFPIDNNCSVIKAKVRTFLRKDPDIIMLGEISDHETSQMAIRAALTRYLVFSTIHTNSAIGTISRLLDMGIPAYLVANTLNLSMAQRLVRLLCPHCKKEEPFDASLLPKPLPFLLETHYTAQGCEQCLYTGYSGRKAIYELLPVNTQLAEKIKANSLEQDSELKIPLLKDAALELFRNGDTSLDEIYSYLL